MKDLKFEQKRSLSRLEAADQLTALASALREGGDAELELGAGTLSLRIPDDLRSEMEVEIGEGRSSWRSSSSGRRQGARACRQRQGAAVRAPTEEAKPRRARDPLTRHAATGVKRCNSSAPAWTTP